MFVKYRLKELLEEKNITKYRLAKMTDINENALTKIERNESKQARFDTLEKICKALDCKLTDLLVEVDIEEE